MMKQIIEPWMPQSLPRIDGGETMFKELRDQEERVAEMQFFNLTIQKEDFDGICVSKVIFDHCTFLDCTFLKGEFTDVVFQSCDFSNSDFSDGYFNRCRFLASKGMGTKFCGCSIQNLLISECNLNYSNFDSCKLEKIRIEKSQLSGGNFSQCRCKNVSWENNRLTGASFFKTMLNGMDFSTSDINGIALSDDLRELKGAVMDLYQAAELMKRLGVIVKD